MSKIKEKIVNVNDFDEIMDFDLDEDYLYQEYLWKKKCKEIYNNLDYLFQL